MEVYKILEHHDDAGMGEDQSFGKFVSFVYVFWILVCTEVNLFSND